MTTLADFLLARIAEDERHARKLAETDTRPVLSLAVTVNHPARVLAECEAKRRIVEYLGHTAENEFGWDGMDWFVLEHLALPYADHEDFQDEWRP